MNEKKTEEAYLDLDTKVIIICKEHGEFEVTPRNHLAGQGCPDCSDYVKQ
jgi:hypothetical protein